MHSLSGAGLPGAHITNGPAGQSVSGVFAGTGMDTSFPTMHTGRHTSTMDPVSNPRGTISTQYFLDSKNMNLDADIGNMELCWADVQSGPPQVFGEKKPMVIKSWTAMNRMFKSPEGRAKWGNEKNTRWFNQKYSFIGVLRHENQFLFDAARKGNHSICQVFNTGGRVRMLDIFQSCDGGGISGVIEIGDKGYAILMKFPYFDELARLRGEAKQDGWYWALVPFWSKKYAAPPISAFHNHVDGTIGEAFRLVQVAALYDAPMSGATAIARQYVWNPTADGSYKKDISSLRHIEVEVCTTL